jgi:hypothetical protein
MAITFIVRLIWIL